MVKEVKEYKPLKPSAAFNKGVDYGVELVILYGTLIAITAYEINKTWKSNIKEDQRRIKV